MEPVTKPRRRFGSEFVEGHRRRHGKRPPEQRQLTYDIAVLDTYAEWRGWLDDQLELLDPAVADGMANRLWLNEQFWTVVFELAAGAGLRTRGMRVAYEREWNGLRPDWTVLFAEDLPLCFVEVHTDSPPQQTYGQMRPWQGLVERIKDIPVSVVVTLATTGQPTQAPDPRTAKRIAHDLRHSLMQPSRQPYHTTSQGYTFVIQAEPHGRTTRPSPLGPHASFIPPSPIAGLVSAQRLTKRIEEKTHKYAELAEAHGVPLIVAVGAHRFTGLELAHLDDLLTGSQTMTFQFGYGDTHIGEAPIDLGQPLQWTMPTHLTGIYWIDNQLPFKLTWRANPQAHRLMPTTLEPS